MTRNRSLRFLLAATAAAWVMVVTAMVGIVAMHLADRSKPHVVYQRAYVPVPARPVLVQTPQGPRVCCPPPPCCPRGHFVAYVPYSPYPPNGPAAPRPMWPFALAGLLGAAAVVSSLVAGRRIVPVQS